MQPHYGRQNNIYHTGWPLSITGLAGHSSHPRSDADWMIGRRVLLARVATSIFDALPSSSAPGFAFRLYLASRRRSVGALRGRPRRRRFKLALGPGRRRGGDPALSRRLSIHSSISCATYRRFLLIRTGSGNVGGAGRRRYAQCLTVVRDIWIRSATCGIVKRRCMVQLLKAELRGAKPAGKRGCRCCDGGQTAAAYTLDHEHPRNRALYHTLRERLGPAVGCMEIP